MTDTQTQTVESTPAPAAFDALVGESMSPAELAYFNSGGSNTDGLVPAETNGAASVASQQTEGEARPTGQTPEAAPTEQKANGEDEPGVIEISADGKMRDTKTGRFVPHQAFHAEREKRKGLEVELSKAREQAARFDERLAVLNEAFKGNLPASAQQTQDTAAPDPEKDIFGAFKWATERIAKLESKLDNTSNETKLELAKQTLRSHYDSTVTAYRKTQPAFDAAKTFLTEGRHKELEALGYADAAERQRMIDSQEAQLAINAYRNKSNAAEMLYKLAVARGFNPTPPAQEQNKQSEAALKLDQIAKGQAAAASLTTAAGGPTTQLTAEAVLNMDEAQFDAAVKKAGGQAALMRLVGMV